MTVLSLSNIINVTITNTPRGLTERNINTVALFTNETPAFLEDYAVYVSAAAVATDFGTDSVTAAMANAIFAQTPNIRSGNGRLVVVPMVATSATSGYVSSPDLSSTLASIILVTDGDLEVTIDGVDYNLTGLNFTLCETWADIAEVLQKKIQNGIVTALANGFRITSKKVGVDADVTYGAVSGGTGTDLAATGYFKASTSVPVSGADSSGESLVDAIARVSDQVFFAGIITNLEIEDDEIELIAAAVQPTDRIFLHHFSSTADIAGIGTTISEAGYTKTRCLLYTDSLASANLMKSAYTGRAFSVAIGGSDTAITMNLKELVGITADENITQTNYDAAKVAGMDIYVSYGVPGVLSTGGNDYFDNVYANIATKLSLEEYGFNFLKQTNTKVSQTESGMNGLKNAYAQSIIRLVTTGFYAPGSWTSSETFGDPEIFRQNILNNGYYIYSEPVVSQSALEREAREAPLVQIALKRAGAIQSSDVIVVIND